MAGSFGDFLENELLDHIFGCGDRNWSLAGNLWVALSSADPGDDGAGLAEPTGIGSYARVSTTSSDWNVAASGSVSNANDITFPEATASWGTQTHFALMDAVSGGNMLAHGSLDTSKTIDSGDTAKFTGGTPGDLQVSLT